METEVNEIREAIETIETMKPCEERFKAEGKLISLAKSYLALGEEWHKKCVAQPNKKGPMTNHDKGE